MSSLKLRPRTDHLIRSWGRMIENAGKGPGYDCLEPQQKAFEVAVQAFCETPSVETFDAIWSAGTAVEADNPGGPLLRASFDGDIDELAAFVEDLRRAEGYERGWEDRLDWRWALWELFTRCNTDAPAILHSEASAALSWFGVVPSGEFSDRLQTLEQFKEHYRSLVGHPTAGTDYEIPVRTELDELFHVIERLDKDAIAAELKGSYGDFYRSLYGGGRGTGGRTEPVRLVDIADVILAYSWGKANDAYDEPDRPEFWGGKYWETWKESYANHVRSEIRDRFNLDDLDPEDIGPLFDALTDSEGSDLAKPVARQIMGNQWGQYTWNDVVNHFMQERIEASRILSLFFDDSLPSVTRLSAFREHTIHLTETGDRSPGSIERMATSLLMFTFPERHLGLPSSRTGTFLEEKSTLPEYKSGFRPQQYRTIIGPLRGLRDEIQQVLDEHDVDGTATMLDVHTLIWVYGGEGEPEAGALPPTEW